MPQPVTHAVVQGLKHNHYYKYITNIILTQRILFPVNTLLKFCTQTQKSGQVHKLTQYQVKEWTAEGVGSNKRAVVDIIDQLSVVQRRTGNKPIVVHGK